MSLSKVISLARGELGTCEEPSGSNLTKYGLWYGVNGVPWCVIFLCWLFNQAGERMAFFGGGKTASCSILLRWYKEQGLTVPVSEVQAGDIVLLNFHGKSDPEHCGLVEKVAHGDDGKAQAVFTIEGNTTPSGNEYGPEANGGCVAFKTRYPRQIIGVCRPQYQPEPVTVDDIAGHWYTDDVKWCIEHGFIKNYPDGSFKPDQPVTRAELATVIRRLVKEKEDDLK